jgi:FixJ family two-component response regulator
MRSNCNTYVGVVDDDESICRSLARLLRAAGFEAITYPSGEAMLEDLKHPQFDCLVLDVQLGGMSGPELKQRLTAEGRCPPVIFMTAHDDPDARTKALADGCAAYFRKTDSGSEILQTIHAAVNQAEISDAPSNPSNNGNDKPSRSDR